MGAMPRFVIFTIFRWFLVIILGTPQNNTAVADTEQDATDGELFFERLVNGHKIPKRPEYLVFTAPYRICKGGCKSDGDNLLMKFPIYVGNNARKQYQTLYPRDYSKIIDKQPMAPFRRRSTREITTTTECSLNLNVHLDLVSTGESSTCPTTNPTVPTTTTDTPTTTTDTPATTTDTPATTTDTPTTTTTTTTQTARRMCPYIPGMCIKKQNSNTPDHTNEHHLEDIIPIPGNTIDTIVEEAVEDLIKIVQAENIKTASIMDSQTNRIKEIVLENVEEIMNIAELKQSEVLQKIVQDEISEMEKIFNMNTQKIQKSIQTKSYKVLKVIDNRAKGMLEKNDISEIQEIANLEIAEIKEIFDVEKRALNNIIEFETNELKKSTDDTISEIKKVGIENDDIKKILENQILKLQEVIFAAREDLLKLVDADAEGMPKIIEERTNEIQKFMLNDGSVTDPEMANNFTPNSHDIGKIIKSTKILPSTINEFDKTDDFEVKNQVISNSKEIAKAIDNLIAEATATEAIESTINNMPMLRYFRRINKRGLLSE